MTITIYHKSPDAQGLGNAIAKLWGYDENNEWVSNYRIATAEDIEYSDNHYFAKFPNYAVSTPTWKQLLADVAQSTADWSEWGY